MDSKKVQLYLDREKAIEASPVTGANCVILSDGNDLQKVLNNDLTNPTVAHEESSFKTGVGDIDVSSSVVDGEVGRMVIKGKTYQNILPEPSTHVLTNNKEMFKVNEGLDPNVEIVDGVSKSAILKGQTLVNLVSDGEVTKNATNNWVVFSADFNADMIKTSTDYTLITYVISNTLSDGSGCDFGVSGGLNDGFGFKAIRVPSGKVGVYKIKLTTKNVFSQPPVLRQQIFNDVATGSITFKQVLVEGDYTNIDIPYFEGMKSVKVPVLTTTGKNLLNNDWERGGLSLTNGTIQESSDAVRTKTFSKVTPITNYIVSMENFTFGQIYYYDKNYNFISRRQFGENNLRITTPDNCEYIKVQILSATTNIKVQLEEGSQATPYEPYKSNILTVNEEVELRGIGEVKDELNLESGKLAQRIGEIVFDGSENISDQTFNTINHTRIMFKFPQFMMLHGKSICSHTPIRVAESHGEWEYCLISNDTVYLQLSNSKLETPNIDGVRKYMAQQYQLGTPITIHYQLAEKVVKTVDLSSSGNWEKVVLDGSENWTTGDDNLSSVYRNYVFLPNNIHGMNLPCFVNDSNFPNIVYGEDKQGVVYGADNRAFYVFSDKKKYPTLESFKKYLQQNPMTVWYQTQNHLDSTQVKQPIFFKDGHVIQSSGTDNSLIPTLDYQAKTSNSYVMDLMKANTRYTMKASGVSGTATIGNAGAFTLNTNRTFTSPASQSLFDNKLLVIKGSATDLMIIEGDVTSKTIPYFKGIKSAFEGEDKIEVLSTGKNLAKVGYDIGEVQDGYIKVINETTVQDIDYTHRQGVIEIKPNTTYTCSWVHLSGEATVKDSIVPCYAIYDKDMNVLKWASYTTTTPSNAKYIGRVRLHWRNSEAVFTNFKFAMQLEESPTATSYEPYKSNVTKIPLLSPLRSLPNGVCDELIIDRMKKKATLIQRVGHVVFTSNLSYNTGQDSLKTSLFTSSAIYPQASGVRMCNRFLNDEKSNLMLDSMQAKTESEGLGSWSAKENFNIRILASRLGGVPSTSAMTNWLKENPVTILYHLKTPIVTEIDLENFPFIYKDGHIFLNSEIAPVVEIDYNVNQSQQIQANNETLQRHELDILDLDNLIVSFVNAEYNLRLLKFDMELSMMALAE